MPSAIIIFFIVKSICKHTSALLAYEDIASKKIRISELAFSGYPEPSSTEKQQEHGVSKPAVQLIVTRHRQSQQIWAVLSSKLALEMCTESTRKQ